MTERVSNDSYSSNDEDKIYIHISWLFMELVLGVSFLLSLLNDTKGIRTALLSFLPRCSSNNISLFTIVNDIDRD